MLRLEHEVATKYDERRFRRHRFLDEPERILFEAADPDREGGSFGGYLPTLGIFLIFPVFLKKIHDFSMKFINF